MGFNLIFVRRCSIVPLDGSSRRRHGVRRETGGPRSCLRRVAARRVAVSDVVSSALFADISGSVTADTAALTGVMVPQLVRDRYPLRFASGLQAAAGTLGVLFPPSLSAIIYAAVANVSVGYLFAALLLPAIIVTVTFAIIAIILSAKRGYGIRYRFGVRASGRATINGFPAIGVIVVVLGGLFSGTFTVTEAGAFAATYTLLLGVFGYRDKSEPFFRTFLAKVITSAVSNAGRIAFIIAAATLVSVEVTSFNGPQELIADIQHWHLGHAITLLVIVFALIALNSVLETIATILITVPILVPVLTQMNVGLGHFGVVMQMSASVGLALPPLGLALFLVSGVTGVPPLAIAKSAAPFALGALADLLFVLFVPSVTTILPHLFGFVGS